MRKVIPLLISILFISTHLVHGINRIVPGEYPSIQQALDASASGDTVFVFPCVYNENIVWPLTNGIRLYSIGDSSNTIIDGSGAGIVMDISGSYTFQHDTNTVVCGFTIRNGHNSGSGAGGGGVYLYKSSAKFIDVLITNNHIGALNWAEGAGLHLNESNSIFINSSISNNVVDSSSWGHGGGVYMTDSDPQFYNVKIDNNTINCDSWNFGGGLYCDESSPKFINVSISNNLCNHGSSWYKGAGIFMEDTDAEFVNVLIASNKFGTATGGGWYDGGAIFSRSYSSGNQYKVDMKHVTIADNGRLDNGMVDGLAINVDDANISFDIVNSIIYNQGGSSEISPLNGTFSISYTNIRGGYNGTNIINTNPMFVSASDYHLQDSTVCCEAGILTGSPLFDIENNVRPMPLLTNPDLGCYENQGDTTTINPSAINELSGLEMKCYPNPTNDKLFIKSNSVSFRVRVFSVSGQLILEAINTKVIDLDGQNPGIYILEITDGESIGRKKIILQ